MTIQNATSGLSMHEWGKTVKNSTGNDDVSTTLKRKGGKVRNESNSGVECGATQVRKRRATIKKVGNFAAETGRKDRHGSRSS